MPCSRTHETPIEKLLAAPDSPECVEFLRHCEVCEACSAELKRQRRRMRPPASSRTMLAVGFAVALTVIVSMWMGWTNFGAADPPQTDDTRADANRSGSIRAMVATAKPDVAGVPQYRILSGETIEISISPQRGNQPVAFSLGLGEPSRDDEPRAVRLIATDGRILELNGALAADRMTAAIEVPAEFLSPGRYLVEMTTTEATHFPLRRFVVVVRSTQAEPQ